LTADIIGGAATSCCSSIKVYRVLPRPHNDPPSARMTERLKWHRWFTFPAATN